MTDAAHAGARLRLLRDFFGWSQTDVATMSGSTQTKVSNIEKGIAEIDDAILDAMVQLGFPRAFFADPIVDFPHDSSLRFRSNSSKRLRDAAQIRARLRLVAEAVDRLSQALPESRVSTRPHGAPDRIEDVEDVAEQVRVELGLGLEDPISNTIRAAERGGVVVVPLPEGMRGHDGASVWPDPFSRPIIGYKAGIPGDRLRMTIGHELGHLVMHPPGVSGKQAEDEAKWFAGAFLLPRKAASEIPFEKLTLTQFRQLKAMTGMSISGLIMRGRQLGAMSETRQVSLFRQLSARGWRKAEPVRVPAERPILLERMIKARYGDRDAISRAATDLHIPPHILASFLAPAEHDRSGDVVSIRR